MTAVRSLSGTSAEPLGGEVACGIDPEDGPSVERASFPRPPGKGVLEEMGQRSRAWDALEGPW